MTYGMHCIDCLASLVHDIDIEELIEELNKVD